MLILYPPTAKPIPCWASISNYLTVCTLYAMANDHVCSIMGKIVHPLATMRAGSCPHVAAITLECSLKVSVQAGSYQNHTPTLRIHSDRSSGQALKQQERNILDASAILKYNNWSKVLEILLSPLIRLSKVIYVRYCCHCSLLFPSKSSEEFHWKRVQIC